MLVYELAASLYVLCRIYYYIAIKNHLVYWRRQDLTCWFHKSKRSHYVTNRRRKIILWWCTDFWSGCMTHEEAVQNIDKELQ
jgi:hypothetical protein